MTHADFETILAQSSLSHSSQSKEPKRPVRVQWDPERTPTTRGKLPYRSIQIGIGRQVAETWAQDMILSIEDVTDKARAMYEDVEAGMSKEDLADKYINERVYEVQSEEARKAIGLDLPENTPGESSNEA
ncbi:hypothetical protein ABW19_dt0200884 [Dactylella cylindrospora]|nr:hypothetical protein ABW19_dt0200884 [Dactylella cylindrospora]